MLERNREHPFQRMDTLGMTPRVWVRVLSGVPRPIHAGFEHRALGAGALAVANSVGRRMRRAVDTARGPLPDDTEVLFIVGHWRSGTTMLHHLLATSGRWATLPTSMAVFPELHGTPLLMPVLNALGIGQPYRRLIDNVMLSPDSPMELEFAILNLTGESEYLSVTFPMARRRFLRYLRADPRDSSDIETARWRQAVLTTTARLARGGRPVLHKNPPSTSTIAELKDLFPRARFVFLHRDPLGVYKSTMKTWRTLTEAGTLQWGGDEGLSDYVLDRYEILHRAYLEQRELLSQDELVELTFEELLADPMAAVHRIVGELGLDPIDPEPLESYLEQTKRYRRGSFQELDPGIRELVERRWGPIRAALQR